MKLITGILLLSLLMAGCGGGGGGDATPVRRPPTAIPPTPTARSTALPASEPVAQLGDRNRPLVILFALSGAELDTAAFETTSSLQAYLEDQLNMTVQVDFVDTDTQALDAICGRTVDGLPTAAWISSFTFYAAEQQCGAIPALALTRGTGTRVSIGTTAEIVVRAGFDQINQLAGQTFCRINDQDYTSWVLPSLIFASEGIDTFTHMSAILDFPDSTALVRAIYENECTVAALPPDEFEDILDEVADQVSTENRPIDAEDIADLVRVLTPAGDISLPDNLDSWRGYDPNVMPYSVFVFPRDTVIPASMRAQIVEAVTEFSERSDGEALLPDILNATGFVAVSTGNQPGSRDHYANFRDLLRKANWDMAFLD